MDWGIRSDAETGLYSEGVWIKLSDCPSIFRERFEKAREAIKKGHISALREAVFSLKAPDIINQFEIPNEHLLDVCDETDGSYFMTLLAYAGYHFTPDNFDILNFLIEQDARVDMGTPRTGTPLLQMLVYAYHEQERNNLPKIPVHIDVVRFFLDNGAILSRILYAGDYNKSTALELGIIYQRFDICHLLVERGANPFLCGDGVVSPLLVEYACFGTHGFLQRLLDDYLTHSEIPATDFVSHLLETGVLFRNDMKNTLMEAQSGCVDKHLLDGLIMTIKDYRDRVPPKSLGKEEFGGEYHELIAAHTTECGLSKEDIIASITEFTAVMVAESYDRYVRPHLDQEQTSTARDLFVSGGGAHNSAIMRCLDQRLSGVNVATTAELGVNPDAKEAMCFALLAYQTLHRVPTSIPSVTGASGPALLGKICPVLQAD